LQIGDARQKNRPPVIRRTSFREEKTLSGLIEGYRLGHLLVFTLPGV
jgi:hypothetical protein